MKAVPMARNRNSHSTIDQLVQAIKKNADVAYAAYAPLVDELISAGVRDPHEIESLLDRILDFCFDKRMVEVYRKLCRHYWTIDQRATAEYVYAYKDMWDNDSAHSSEES